MLLHVVRKIVKMKVKNKIIKLDIFVDFLFGYKE